MACTRVALVAFWMVCFLAPVAGAQTTKDTISARKHLTRFKRQIVDRHQQLYDASCIPMSLEMVLKLLERVPSSYYDLQNPWKNKIDGNFSNFDGKTIAGVTFHKQFGLARNDQFPLDKLFEVIDKELKAGRFVIVSLASEAGWHMYVIYDEHTDGDFLAVSKAGAQTIEARHLKSAIKQMQGTDIMTYDPGKPVPSS
jgi:hypothetical protein